MRCSPSLTLRVSKFSGSYCSTKTNASFDPVENKLSVSLSPSASNDVSRQALIHRLAVGTALLSLLPIVMGSLVTTLGAGMAFLDWPTSDGHDMLTYPWLQSHGDQFIEHGHRLAGMLIGFCGIGLVVAAWTLKASTSIKRGAVIALLGIVIQGLIGGARVRLDQQIIAMGHSIFGCLVFVVLWEVARLTQVVPQADSNETTSFRNPHPYLSLCWPIVCFFQYVMGAFLRHLGQLMHDHLGGALLLTFGGIAVVFVSSRATPAIRRCSRWVAYALALQIAFGLAVWVLKFGFAPMGYVATQRSLAQIILRSLHTVGGMAVMVTAVAWAGSVWRSRQS